MIALIDRRAFVWYATVSVVVVLLLEVLIYYKQLDIAVDDLPLWFLILYLHSAVLGVTLVLAAVGHAWGRKRHKWAVLMFFVWPLAFLYALLGNSHWVNE